MQRDVTAVTTADRIRVRETPSADSAQVNQLEAGTRVIVISDPVADPSDPALEWWYVMPSEAPCPSCEIDMRPGWMTTGPDKSWLRAVTPVCPDRPTFTAQTWDHGYWPPVLLQCFGNDPVVFEGVIDYICCPGITFGVTEPSWLARPFYDGSGGVARLTAEDISWGPEFHLDPASGVELGERGTVARLTGHFDDPAAQGCVTTVDQPDLEANPDLRYVTDAPLAIWGCRNSFVVDDVEVLDFIPLPTRAPQG